MVAKQLLSTFIFSTLSASPEACAIDSHTGFEHTGFVGIYTYGLAVAETCLDSAVIVKAEYLHLLSVLFLRP